MLFECKDEKSQSILWASMSPSKPTSHTGLGLRIWNDWLWRPTITRMVSEPKTSESCLNFHVLGAGRRRLTKTAFSEHTWSYSIHQKRRSTLVLLMMVREIIRQATRCFTRIDPACSTEYSLKRESTRVWGRDGRQFCQLFVPCLTSRASISILPWP